MRKFALVGLCLMVGGCGLMARRELAEQQAAAKATMAEGMEACEQQFPKGGKQYVAKNECQANAAKVIRPYANFPDLFDKYWADRSVTAERLQAGKLTYAEAAQIITDDMASISAEEQRRSLANRSVGAQESMASAAWRASAPVSCTRVGNTTNCY